MMVMPVIATLSLVVGLNTLSREYLLRRMITVYPKIASYGHGGQIPFVRQRKWADISILLIPCVPTLRRLGS